MHRSISLDDVKIVQDMRPVKFVIKCVQNSDDSERLADVGVDVDVGVIMNGADIVALIALGAKLTLIDRAYLYGLMAGGRAGVDRTILILSDQVVRTVKVLEVTSVEEPAPTHVTQLERLTPRARSSPPRPCSWWSPARVRGPLSEPTNHHQRAVRLR